MVVGKSGTISTQFKYYLNTYFLQNGIQRGAAAEGRRPSLEGRPEAAPPFCMNNNISIISRWYLDGPRCPRDRF